MNNGRSSRNYRPAVLALWALLVLFCLRVVGQLIVAFWAPGWLPPMQEWYSGLIPYRFLLPAQLLIIGLLLKVCIDLSCERGFFVRLRPAVNRAVLVFGFVYLGGMIIRYLIRMAIMPEERWFGGCIPIFMHWGLALFVILFARHQLRVERDLTESVK